MAAMIDIALSLPESLVAEIKTLAARKDTSVDELLQRALTDSVAMMSEQQYLDDRAARSRPGELGRFLATFGTDVQIAGDELPDGWPSTF